MAAVERAAGLAGATGARLTVLCAFEEQAVTGAGRTPRPVSPFDADWAFEVVGKAAAAASALAAEPVATRTWPGSPALALISQARALAVELLVVGFQGAGSSPGSSLGSVPVTLSRHAPCDLLIVRP